MIDTLFWISIFAGALLVLMLLLSLLGGLDLDLDIGSEPDIDSDSGGGGLGLIKSILTFISIGGLVVKFLLEASINPLLSFAIGAAMGMMSVLILAWFFAKLLSTQEYVNWSIEDALNRKGKVYIPVYPDNTNGIVQVEINGSIRELKAKSDSEKLSTGTEVLIFAIKDDYVIVKKAQEEIEHFKSIKY